MIFILFYKFNKEIIFYLNHLEMQFDCNVRTQSEEKLIKSNINVQNKKKNKIKQQDLKS